MFTAVDEKFAISKRCRLMFGRVDGVQPFFPDIWPKFYLFWSTHHINKEYARQLAIAGIAFVVGLSGTTTGLSAILFWTILIVFGLSVLFGLLFLMHGVHRLTYRSEFSKGLLPSPEAGLQCRNGH